MIALTTTYIRKDAIPCRFFFGTELLVLSTTPKIVVLVLRYSIPLQKLWYWYCGIQYHSKNCGTGIAVFNTTPKIVVFCGILVFNTGIDILVPVPATQGVEISNILN